MVLVLISIDSCRVEQAVHVILYEQLTHWLLYGLLLDPHQELFVKAEMKTITSTSSSNSNSTPDIEALVINIQINVVKFNEQLIHKVLIKMIYLLNWN